MRFGSRFAISLRLIISMVVFHMAARFSQKRKPKTCDSRKRACKGATTDADGHFVLT